VVGEGVLEDCDVLKHSLQTDQHRVDELVSRDVQAVVVESHDVLLEEVPELK